jgi:hypothetical protein
MSKNGASEFGHGIKPGFFAKGFCGPGSPDILHADDLSGMVD